MKIALSIPGFGKIDSGLPVPTGGLNTTGVDAMNAFLNLTLVIAVLVALFFIGKGGLDMITSGGEKEKLKSGQNRVIYAVVGLIVIFLSFTLVNALSAFFGFNLLPFVVKPE